MKTFYVLGCLTVAIVTCIGCSKVESDGLDHATGTHTVTVVAQKDIDTRTYVVEGENTASYYWDIDDKQYFHIYENGILPTSLEMTLSDGGRIASFEATFPDTDATSFTYSAIYAQEIPTFGDLCVPFYQCPTHSSYDPGADVLVSAESVKLKDGARADENTVIQFKMRRMASVNKITVKGIEPGEKVMGVALYSDQPLGGELDYEDEGTRYVPQKELRLDLYNWDEADRVVGSDGSVSVYFLSLPVTKASTTVRVWTEKNVYKRDLASRLTLEKDVFRRFSVTMKEVSPQLWVSASYFSFYIDDPLEYVGRTRDLTITNVGDRSASLNVTTTGTNPSYYSISPLGGFVLGPGESMTVTVHFTLSSGYEYLGQYETVLFDTILIQTDAFTYEVPMVAGRSYSWEEPK